MKGKSGNPSLGADLIRYDCLTHRPNTCDVRGNMMARWLHLPVQRTLANELSRYFTQRSVVPKHIFSCFNDIQPQKAPGPMLQ